MLSQYLTPSVLVLIAGGVQIFGYLLINQTHLRLTMLCSTTLYILYYATVAASPLWEAMAISSLTLLSILIGLVALYARNASWAVPEAHRDIYPLFGSLQPGDFKHVMHLARRETIADTRMVTREGEVPENLYYVTRGTFYVRKGDMRFEVPGPTFIGEVAYLRGGASAATTTLPSGVEVVVWSRATLARSIRRAPRVKLAMDALISRDLATKVSLAVSPDARRV